MVSNHTRDYFRSGGGLDACILLALLSFLAKKLK